MQPKGLRTCSETSRQQAQNVNPKRSTPTDRPRPDSPVTTTIPDPCIPISADTSHTRIYFSLSLSFSPIHLCYTHTLHTPLLHLLGHVGHCKHGKYEFLYFPTNK